MKFTVENETAIIMIEEGETVQSVLRAIGKATFESAVAVGMGLIHFNQATILSDEDVDNFIDLERGKLEMDYVQGRQVKTYVSAKDDGSLSLSYNSFARDRGNPTIMLERAQQIAGGAGEPVTGQSLSPDMFKGKNLDDRLRAYGVIRKPDETDWQLRQRAFPTVWKQGGPDQGTLILYTRPSTALRPMDAMLLLATTLDPSPNALNKLADGYHCDPALGNE